MFDGTLKFDTAIDKTGFKLGLDSLGSIAKTGMAAVGAAVAAAGAGISALGGYAVSVGKEFEAGMSQVGATLGLSVEDIANNAEVTIGGVVTRAGDAMDKLTAKAEEMGAKTSFSATQAAEGLNILAMSGYGVDEAISIINSTLDLAAAGGINLAESASYITGSMKGFASEASNFADETEASAYYADLMAKGATMAATDVNNLGIAMSGAAAIADSYKQNSTETAVALLRLAEQGETGSAAATALSAAMKDLYSPTSTAKKALESLGVSAYTASGEAKDFNEVVGDLDKALSNLTAEERASMEDAIFGIQGKAAFDKMIVSTEDKVQSFYDGLSEASGSAATQAQTMIDNLEGDLTIMNSAAEGFGISIYKALNDPLRDLVQTGTGYIGQLTEAFEDNGFEGLAEAFGDVLGQAVTKISEYIPTIAEMGASVITEFVSGIIGNMGAISEAASQIMVIIVDTAVQVIPQVLSAGLEVIGTLAQGLAQAAPQLFDAAAEGITQLIDGLTASLPAIVQAGMDILTAFADSLVENLPELLTVALNAIKLIADSLIAGLPQLLSTALTIIQSLADAVLDNIPLLIEIASQLLEELADFLIESIPILMDAAIKLFMGIVDALPKIISALAKELPKILDTIWKLFPQIAAAITEALPTVIDAIVEALPIIIDSIAEALPEIITGIAEALLSNAPKLIEAAIELFSSLVDALPIVLEALLDQLPTIISAVITTLVSAAPQLAEASLTLLLEIVKAIPQVIAELVNGLSELWNSVSEWWSETTSNAISAIAEWLKTMLDNAVQGAVDIVTGVMEFLDELPGKIGEMLGTALGNIVKWCSEAPEKARDAASRFLENIKSFFTKLPGNVKDYLDKAISKVVDWAKSLRDKGKNAAKDLVNAVVNDITSLPSKMADAGKNLVQGLWNGITGAANWLKEKISDFGQGIINGFKSAFGIASPSKLMRDEVGRYIAEGVGVGFTEEIPEVGRDAVKAFEQIELVSPEIELPPLELSVPDIEIPELTVHVDMPDIDFDDDTPKPRPVSIDDSAYSALNTQSANINSSFVQPTAASAVINNSYTYNNTPSGTGGSESTQELIINAQFVVGEEVVAEGVRNILVDEVDKQQGIEIQLKKRGLTT